MAPAEDDDVESPSDVGRSAFVRCNICQNPSWANNSVPSQAQISVPDSRRTIHLARRQKLAAERAKVKAMSAK